ncbi:MAG: hypothetical protein K6E62_00425 [Lachnospiraceae bacterium]|nr:hypothetical protein [Lachnospiraceae bacterium]
MNALTDEWIDSMARSQFRLDTACSEETERRFRVMLNRAPDKQPEGARIYLGTEPLFRFIVYGADAYLMAGAELFECIRESFGKRAPEWMLKARNLRTLDKILNKEGLCIYEIQECFLPRAEEFEEELAKKTERVSDAVRPLFSDEIKKITGLNGENAALGNHAFPGAGTDTLGFGFYNDKECLGVCGAERDGRYLWQIGVDVKEEYSGLGIATVLIREAAVEVLRRGFLPFYGTNPGHIVSMRAALSAGFRPAWTEVFACTSDKGRRDT